MGRTERVLLAVVLLLAGCEDSSTQPAPPPLQQIPEPVEVTWEGVPTPFNDRTYFRHGMTQLRPDSTMQDLIQQGFRLKNAWYALGENCSTLPFNIFKALIVELERNDRRILDHGFGSSPVPVGIACFSHSEFLYYAFTP